MKVFESVFGEGVKLDKLDHNQVQQLRKELIEYAKDWPEEVFALKLNDSQKGAKGADVDESGINKVANLIGVIADGEGWDLDVKKLPDAQVLEILSGLKGIDFTLEKSNQDVWEDEDTWTDRDFDITFSIKNIKYHRNEDLGEIEVQLKKVEES